MCTQVPQGVTRSRISLISSWGWEREEGAGKAADIVEFNQSIQVHSVRYGFFFFCFSRRENIESFFNLQKYSSRCLIFTDEKGYNMY